MSEKLGKQLRDQLEKIFFISQDATTSFRICDRDVLQRLWPEDYDMVANRDLDVGTHLAEILKYRSAVRLIGALESFDENGARGLVALWYSFLEPPASQRQMPSLQQVLRYAASHTSDLSQTIVALLKRSQGFRQNVRIQNTLNASLVSHNLQNLFRELRGSGSEVVEKVPPSTRRTWANYLMSAFNTLAHEIYAVTPEVFITGQEKPLALQANIRSVQSEYILAPAETRPLELVAQPANPADIQANLLAQIRPHQLEQLLLEVLGEQAHFREDNEEGDHEGEFHSSSTSDPDWSRRWLAMRLDELAEYTMDICGHHDFAFGIELPIRIQVERELVLESKGDTAKRIGGKNIPDPLKGRVALLSAHPGTGRTSLLRLWAYRSASDWLTSTTAKLPFYISAKQFRDYVVNDFNIYRYITDCVFPNVGPQEASVLRGVLELLDRTDHLLIIVDDLDRLTQADQNKTMDKLLFSRSVVYATIPSDAIWIRSKLPDYKNPLTITFNNLTHILQIELLSKISLWFVERDCDLILGQYVLQGLPYLSESPLGVLAIYSQLVKHQTTQYEVVDNYLQEMLRRAGLSPSDFSRGWYSSDPIVGSLLKMARIIANKLHSWEPERGESLVLGASIDHFDSILASSYWRTDWNSLWLTRLFMMWGERDTKAWSFCNHDVLCFLAAIDNYYDFHFRKATHPFVAQLDRQMVVCFEEHWEKYKEQDNRMRAN